MDPQAPPPSIAAIVVAALPAVTAAVFAGASAALASISPTRRAALLESLEGGRRRALDRYIRQRDWIETRWLVLRVLGIGTSAVLFSRLLPVWLDGWRPVLAALIALVAFGLPAEAIMAASERKAEGAAIPFLRILRPFEWVATPLAAPIVVVGRLVGRSTKAGDVLTAQVAEDELELMVAEGERLGALDHDRSEMIRNVLDFGELTAGDVMVPRTRVEAFDITIDRVELRARILESEHSRYPVYRERIDNVVGILHVKDLLLKGETVDDLDKLLRKPVVFVPETQAAGDLFKAMRAERHHMAITVDEFGGMSGIVTMEDLLEEIVGDIQDEHDEEEEAIIDLGDGRLVVDASTPVADLSRFLGTELPDDGDYTSVGGFIVDHLGRVPTTGSRFQAHGLSFVVRDATERRVSKVEVTPMADAS